MLIILLLILIVIDADKEKIELQQEVDLRLSRIEHLLTRRPLLLNSVILRQNPNNVYEWMKRFKILKELSDSGAGAAGGATGGGLRDANTTTPSTTTTTIVNINNTINKEVEIHHNTLLQAYAEALKTIDPKQANGKLSYIWLSFANYYEYILHDYNSAINVYERAICIDFKSVDELANIWCAWVEMEIRRENYKTALIILTRAVSDPPRQPLHSRTQTTTNKSDKTTQAIITSSDDTNTDTTTTDNSYINTTKTPTTRLIYKNLKIWSLYLDLEESVGSIDTCIAAYNRCIDLKIATPSIILNYTTYLEEHNYFDLSFNIYEKAITMFVYPALYIIYNTYINKFIERYGNTKIERLRDIFENCIKSVTDTNNTNTEYIGEFYIKYAKTEEEYGMIRQALSIYERATRAVKENEKSSMYRLYAKKMEQYYGITKTRGMYVGICLSVYYTIVYIIHYTMYIHVHE